MLTLVLAKNNDLTDHFLAHFSVWLKFDRKNIIYVESIQTLSSFLTYVFTIVFFVKDFPHTPKYLYV